MGRDHILRGGLDGCRVAFVFGQGIEVGQMPACTVEEITEDLNKEVEDGMSLGVFAHRPKKPVKVRKELDSSEVADEEI